MELSWWKSEKSLSFLIMNVTMNFSDETMRQKETPKGSLMKNVKFFLGQPTKYLISY